MAEPWRTSPLPPNWRQIRQLVLSRDGGRCVWILDNGHRCMSPATDVDHIGDNADHSPANLRSLCAPHHRHRTGRQGASARWQRTRRAPEPHPGLIR